MVTVGLTIISVFIINKARAEAGEGTATMKEIFHSLLPVLASWVGTVLAFYFGKENFEAANKSVQDMVKQIATSDDKLKSVKVTDKDVMRLLADITFNKAIASKVDSEIKVQDDLLKFIDDNNNGERLPIIDSKNVVRYIIHQSSINEFARKLIAGKYDALKGKSLGDITLEQVINSTDDEMKNKIRNSISFVSKNATLLEVKEKMKANIGSQDVIVTENGLPAEAVIGWITNNKIIEMSKV
jgi:hypothetical protein